MNEINQFLNNKVVQVILLAILFFIFMGWVSRKCDI